MVNQKDNEYGPGKRYAFPNLDLRLGVDFYGNISMFHKDMNLQDPATKIETPFRLYSLNNHRDGCRHIAFTIQNLSTTEANIFANMLPQFKEAFKDIKLFYKTADENEGEEESVDDLPWSNRIFFYTNKLLSPKADIAKAFRSIGLKPNLVDDEKWKSNIKGKTPDIFISHDTSITFQQNIYI